MSTNHTSATVQLIITLLRYVVLSMVARKNDVKLCLQDQPLVRKLCCSMFE